MTFFGFGAGSYHKKLWFCFVLTRFTGHPYDAGVNNNNNSLYLNTVKTDGSCTADVAVYYNTKQYSTIQYNI